MRNSEGMRKVRGWGIEGMRNSEGMRKVSG